MPDLDTMDRIDEEFVPATMLVKNTSGREYVDVYDSVVFRWKAGETQTIRELMGPPLNEWKIPESPVFGRDAKTGLRIQRPQRLIVKLGGTLKEIWKFLAQKPGCPLVRLRNDGKDNEREAFAQKIHSQHRMASARYEVSRWRKRCAEDAAAGLPIEDKPEYVWQAEEDIILLSKFTDEKRFQVSLDGARFNTKEECRQYIIHPIRWPQYVDTWAAYVQDTKGSAIENPSFDGGDLARAHPTPPGPSPSALGIMKMAAAAKVVLPEEIVARLDSDPDAATDAVEFIMGAAEEEPETEVESKAAQGARRAREAKAAKAAKGKAS